MSGPLIERLIQRQINHWNHLRALLPEPRAEHPRPRRRPVITISRQTGAGGQTLAARLNERLGLTVQDRSLVEQVVRVRGLDPAMVARLDEQDLRQTDLWVHGVLKQRIFLKEEYRRALAEAVSDLALVGGVVFLGRGAHHVLGEHADLRVRLVASPEVRAARLAARHGLDREASERLRDRTDQRRERFVRALFGDDPPSAYDLVLNTDRLGRESVLGIVLQGLLERRAQPQMQAQGA